MTEISNNNRIILLAEDGSERYVSDVAGLKINFYGSNNECKIRKSSGVFDLGSHINFYCNNATVEIGEIFVHASVAISMGENARLYIGKDFSSNGTEFNLIEQNSDVHIGNNVLFARNTKVYSSDMHTIYDIKTKEVLNFKNKIYLADNIWICEDAIILGNSKVQSNSVIAARSLVNKKIKTSNCILAGIPAKVVKRGVAWSRCFPGEFMVQQNSLKGK